MRQTSRFEASCELQLPPQTMVAQGKGSGEGKGGFFNDIIELGREVSMSFHGVYDPCTISQAWLLPHNTNDPIHDDNTTQRCTTTADRALRVSLDRMLRVAHDLRRPHPDHCRSCLPGFRHHGHPWRKDRPVQRGKCSRHSLSAHLWGSLAV